MFEQRFAWSAVVIAALLLSGAVLGSYPAYMIGLAMVNVIAAIGLNLLVGNSGQISLCHSSFMAIGAYSAALLAAYARLPFWVAIPCGTVLAAGVGALLALPARRLGGIYLALATLGFMQIVQIALEEWSSVTGGVRGLKIPKPELWPGAALTPFAVYGVVVAGCVLAVWTAHNLLQSRLGRELNALRLSPHAAQALGISLARIKLTAFTLSAAYAGFAGGLFAQLVGFIDPNEFGMSASIRQLTFIVVGGVGSLAGSVLGAVVLSGLPELLRPVREYNDLAFALVLLAFMLFLPHGLVVLWRGALAARLGRREAVA
ncbi:branched-chain amino acid ABC transporter permease [Variovorax guangxiensis]|uniref:branched-chain amino acid ABC transporter permease n=1 Tax=Variovorax guangxiensis TaxID=1775474 RepID=UPI0028568DEC|nr:branched-chain amino acid ABC transporter permease [Variovorax guangxiensis]MDR6861220.1 branched-chain amino acid transport system permease protein [Variovorax guangxiensis]